MTEQSLWDFSEKLNLKAIGFFARGVDIRSQPHGETGIRLTISYNAHDVSHRFDMAMGLDDDMVEAYFREMAIQLGQMAFIKAKE